MKIAIVTDSTADIPPVLAEQHQIHIVPNLISIDGRNLEDGPQISREEFYTQLPHMKSMPTTGTASNGIYQNLYERLFQKGCDHIISVHAAGALSGIFSAASVAGKIFNSRVTVIDSGQITLGLGFQALAAAEDAAASQPVEAIVAHLASIQKRVRVIAMLDTLEYVRRSGRVSWARAGLGTLLQLKPFVELKDGRVFRLGEARTRSRGIARLAGFLRGLGKLERLAILHTNALQDAQRFAKTMEDLVPAAPLIVNVTTVIGTHVGPNGLGFAAVIA